MKKRYLGIICLLYSLLIIYVLLTNSLKNFLAPNMQIYIKISLIPMIIIGLVLIFNNKINYKFKISDLVLLLPLLMIIFTGDGRLTSNFASNRTTNISVQKKGKAKVKTKEKEKVVEETEELEEVENIEEKEYDFTNPDVDIIDANYSDLSGYITYAPKAVKFKGQTIRVRGFALKDAAYIPDNHFAIGKYMLTCCAADAEFTGFVVKYDNSLIETDKWYEIEGVLEQGKDKEGYDIMYIKAINVKEIDSSSEEQYVYPCYAYDDGLCKDMTKYNLEY